MKKNIKVIVLLALTILFVILCSTLLIFNMDKFESTQQLADNTSSNVSVKEKKILANYEVNFSWDKDPSEMKNLITENSYIVKVKINNIEDAIMLGNDAGIEHDLPLTPIKANVIKTISGNQIDNDIEFYALGGSIKISEKIKNMPEAQIQKMGFDKLSANDKENSYINYSTEYDYNMNIGDEYILVLNKATDNRYYLSCCGFGVFTEDKENDTMLARLDNTMTIKNVLTGKTFNCE